MKKTKEIVLYDDTENYKKFDETRDFLFAVYADENGWACSAISGSILEMLFICISSTFENGASITMGYGSVV